MKVNISIADIWNESIIRTDREPSERNYLWASQLLKPTVDLWLQMRGTKPSNEPNARSRRKFMAGNMFEHFVSMVMMRSGVMSEKQDEVWTHGAIDVKGKGDFILTGKFDFVKAEQDIKNMFLPSSMEEMFLQICGKMQIIYEGIEIEPTVFEIKSVAERTMTKIEKMQKPLESHIMQTCHYKIGRGLKDGVVAVLCRDDLRLFEYHVTPEDEQRYWAQVNRLAEELKTDVQPPLAEKVIFDEILGKFSKNLDIEYSSFLTLLYGYERPDIYADEMKPQISRWNRLLARIKQINNKSVTATGKPILLTDKNKLVLEEIKNAGFDAYKLADIADISNDEEE